MSATSYAQPEGNLLFHWERPRRRRAAIAGFLLASLGLHALCFYLFQVIYPPTIALLPPPARVSLIAPTSAPARSFLDWLDAEDPALASQTQRPPRAREYQLPKLAHIPSYRAVAPQLKPMPPQPVAPVQSLALPPGPVPLPDVAPPAPAALTPSRITFSGTLRERPVTLPALPFQASVRDAPQSARFRVAVDGSGVIRYCLLEQSSGDSALDEQARRALALARFAPAASPNEKLTWATAALDFGTDLKWPPAAEQAP